MKLFNSIDEMHDALIGAYYKTIKYRRVSSLCQYRIEVSDAYACGDVTAIFIKTGDAYFIDIATATKSLLHADASKVRPLEIREALEKGMGK